MSKEESVQNTGQVGRRGAIILSAAIRRRYGLEDGTLFISEERPDGILIRPARAVPADLEEVRAKIKLGIHQLNSGKGIPAERLELDLKQAAAAFRKKRK